MKTVTYEEFLEFAPYWLGKAEWVKPYFDRFGGKMSALDILKLHGICTEDKLYISLREELIPPPFYMSLPVYVLNMLCHLSKNPTHAV